MKTISKLLIMVALIFGFSGQALADARIELDTDTCHFPRSNLDTDNEDKVTCVGVLVETADDGAVAGRSVVLQYDIPANFVPFDTTTSGADSNTACVLRNDDGTEAQIPDWEVNISGGCDIMREIYTQNGPIYSNIPERLYDRLSEVQLKRMGIREICYSRREIHCGLGAEQP